LADIGRGESSGERRGLRNFGLTVGIGFGVLGGLLLWRGRGTYPYFFVAAAALILPGLLAPSMLKPVRHVWMRLAHALGWVMTRVILAVLFYTAFTLVGLLGRLFGHCFLELGIDRSRQTYWIRRDPAADRDRDYEKQF
jgi:hypothetical protein